MTPTALPRASGSLDRLSALPIVGWRPYGGTSTVGPLNSAGTFITTAAAAGIAVRAARTDVVENLATE